MSEPPDPGHPFERTFRALGLPTHRRNGHKLGCLCNACHADREVESDEVTARIQNGEPPRTIGEVLAVVLRRRREGGSGG